MYSTSYSGQNIKPREKNCVNIAYWMGTEAEPMGEQTGTSDRKKGSWLPSAELNAVTFQRTVTLFLR
jgi:hypothetical protein